MIEKEGENINKIPSQQTDLKESILKQVKEYYIQNHLKNSDFKPGESVVNYAGRVFDEEEMINLIDASLDFWLTAGKYCKEFEAKFANYLGRKYCSLTNSGSSANLLAFSALTSYKLKDRQIKKGDEVITVAAGFPTTVAPIIQNGAIPVFVDIYLDNLNINCDLLEQAKSDKTKAVMIAHTLGIPFDINLVKEFCDKYNLWLIEDNCDALGSTYNGKLTGSFGDIGTSSFYPPHHITMGEGGAVYTDNALLKKIIDSFRDWGRDCWCPSGKDNTCGKRFDWQFGDLPKGFDHKYIYSHFGYNLKATDMQAAVGVAQLEKIDIFIEKRKSNYKQLYAFFNQFSQWLKLTELSSLSDPSWFGFFMIVKDKAPFSRTEMIDFLESNLIQTRMLFSGNILKQPVFSHLQENIDFRIASSLENTDIVMNNGFWIGVYPGLTDQKIAYICTVAEQFFGNY